MKKILTSLVLVSVVFSQVHAADYPLKTCVVTGDTFGGDLGPPIEINYKGRLIKLCCKSCVRKFNANPEKYVKILDGAAAK
ncbi:MAG: hypothetical protein ABIT76_02600 [Chthoniobacterales bacterium]